MDDILKLKKKVTDMGHNIKKIEYIDVDTGKVECVDFTGDIIEAFKAGARVVPFKGFLGYEPTKNKDFFTLTHFDTMKAIVGAWKGLNELFADLRGEEPDKKKRHKSGNKKAFVKVYIKELNKLSKQLQDKDLGTLLKLAECVDWDTGILVNIRTKKPLGFEGLRKHLKYSKTTLIDRIDVLKEAEILTKDDEGYKINREFISKG